MDIKKCDRCKKSYDYSAYTNYIYNKIAIQAEGVYTIKYEMALDSYSHKVDLCPECMAKLANWVENGETNGHSIDS